VISGNAKTDKAEEIASVISRNAKSDKAEKIASVIRKPRRRTFPS